jgi:hypothetical protein
VLNRLGGDLESRSHQRRLPPPITLPKLNLGDLDDETIQAEAREAAAKIKTIRLGRDAWEAVAKAESFDGWKAIGAALAVGKLMLSKSPARMRPGAGTTLVNSTCGFGSTASSGCRRRPGAWLSSYTRTPSRLPYGETLCPSASASASFIRYRSHDAGKPLQHTATADAPQTSSATL